MTRHLDTPVAIVGAGPAGLAAALELVRAGARPIVFDEAPRSGGQIFRQAPAGLAVGDAPELATPNHARGHRLLHDAVEAGVTVVGNALVWGARPGRLELEVDGEPAVCRCDHLLIATGAHDRSVPFPGWTLPGVITAGAAQVLVRGFGVTPGTRALVAGSGPLLLPTVAALHARGVEVVACLEAAPRRAALRALPGVLGSPMRRREALHYARTLLRHRTRYRSGEAVIAAGGTDRVTTAVTAPLDRDGRPKRDRARELAIDLLCVGYGLQPQIELAALSGCELGWNGVRGGWLPVHDERMRTTSEGVWVAGEAAGIGGADCAFAEGTLAGLAIADVLSLPNAATRGKAIARAQRERRRERRASDAMLAAFRVPVGLLGCVTGDTVVCRCEDVTWSAIEAGAALHGPTPRNVKMATRAGMGPCQGRICQAPIADLLHHRCGGPFPPPPPAAQIPIKPVSSRTMVEVDNG